MIGPCAPTAGLCTLRARRSSYRRVTPSGLPKRSPTLRLFFFGGAAMAREIIGRSGKTRFEWQLLVVAVTFAIFRRRRAQASSALQREPIARTCRAWTGFLAPRPLRASPTESRSADSNPAETPPARQHEYSCAAAPTRQRSRRGLRQGVERTAAAAPRVGRNATPPCPSPASSSRSGSRSSRSAS